MLIFTTAKTLSLPCSLNPISQTLKPSPRTTSPLHSSLPTRNLDANCKKSQVESERGLQFETGETFFRHESAIGRDLAVLAASLYKKYNGSLRVLDALCGCGVRSLRYLVEAEANFVWANDANDDSRRTISQNLSQVERRFGDERRWTVTHLEANRILTECYLHKDFFDFIDVDSFGSDSSFIRSAFNALKFNGLLYITSTDGFSSGGHLPFHSLAAYGAYIRPLPYSNEIGLRMLIGGAVREASVLGFHVTPLFSYYSYHGPVFRVMLRMNRGEMTDSRHYGFIGYCPKCGNSQTLTWKDLGRITCPCTDDAKVSKSLVVCGPLWTGPLHDADYVTEMLNVAEQWEWTGTGTDLEKVLDLMADESDPNLPFGYIKLDEVARRAKVNSPPLETMISMLRKEGYVVSRSHITPKAIKTNCPMGVCVRIAKEVRGRAG